MNRKLYIFALGPFFYLGRQWKTSFLLLLLFIFLTLLTQVGGVVLWVGLPLLDAVKFSRGFKTLAARMLVFVVLYMCAIILIVPLLAPLGGRVPLPWFGTSAAPLRPANIGFCILARNYVTPPLRDILQRVAVDIAAGHPGATLRCLDANFPFLNGFPLLPHLSHKDGKKVDLAFFYRDAKSGEPLDGTISPIGYWAYEGPGKHEPRPCRNVRSWLRWDFDQLQPAFAHAELDPVRTRMVLDLLIADPNIRKILIEPHLKARLRATSSKVRFQGCHAARHDDHIHVQIH